MQDVIEKLAIYGKGILAADESTRTIEGRLNSVGVDSTPSTRHNYRHTLFSTEGLENYISGVILYDETLRHVMEGESAIDPLIEKGIALGVKVDTGVTPYSGSCKLTEGLDGLTGRLREYKDLGAEFAKWRAVISVGDSGSCILANAWNLARYAKKCQLENIVPIVEPEIIMDGDHSIMESIQTTERVLHHVFDAMFYENVALENMILKPNMISHGYRSSMWIPIDAARVAPNSEQIAYETISSLRRCVPAAVPMIAFLSGGQPDGIATENLNAINMILGKPWYISFSFGRELQQNALRLWAEGKRKDAQDALLERANQCSLATQGELHGPVNI
jgi:fructose-bisphosphate aldolase class I